MQTRRSSDNPSGIRSPAWRKTYVDVCVCIHTILCVWMSWVQELYYIYTPISHWHCLSGKARKDDAKNHMVAKKVCFERDSETEGRSQRWSHGG